ncbi:hypothetical protein BGX27_003060 [Mortierella sp. AM989]|nr:hypothetical protein BGX27_003060 [Mortierella sp. AM989]
MLGSHKKSAGSSGNSSRANNGNTTGGSNNDPYRSTTDNARSYDNDSESNPMSMSARLSAGMVPYFIPPHPQTTLGNARTESGSPLDPSLMTPPMSPTENSFGFLNSTIESRFTSSPHPNAYSLRDQHSKTPNIAGSSGTSSLTDSSATTTGVSPRPLSFHWDRYEDFEEEGDDDQDEQDSQDETDEHEDISMTNKSAYHRQFEGHHSIVRRRSSYGGRGERRGDKQDSEVTYDSIRHGVGLSVSDMSDELAKARSKMSRASRAMKNMEQELEAMQRSIDESKASSATTRSAIEENFWRLECLALTIEKDRQETNKRLQTVGRECSEAVEAVTNWEVRVDWLGRRVDNTSEYVSELVLSEQECMSFIKMIIQQNQRYAMPAISRATERNIKLMAPPRLKEISHAAHQPDTRHIQQPTPQQLPQPQPQPQPLSQPQPQPLQPQPSIRHIPISWLLDPIMPPNPPEILERAQQTPDDSDKEKKPTVEPPAELWRDFSRLTTAFETGQARTPFSPFQRTRSRSTGQGALMSTSGISSSSSGHNNNNSIHGGSMFKTSMTRRPQVENLAPMPKILPPVVATNKLPVVKRRSQNLSHLPVHSWLQFQFNKTVTTPGALGQGGSKKKTSVLGFKSITIFQTTV